MQKGHFYFITDRYFEDFPDPKLMKNKFVNGVFKGRPCFFAYRDTNTGLFWMIPCTSQVDKYRPIFKEKLRRYGRCDTVVFVKVLGHERALLIQNMCPVKQEYIREEYIQASTHKPVVIDYDKCQEVCVKAERVLMLQRKGINLIFPDVLKIEKVILLKPTNK